MTSVEEQVKKLEEQNAVHFGVNACPKPVYEDFVAFAKKASKEAGLVYTSYPVALKRLLENNKSFEAIVAQASAEAQVQEKEKATPEPKKFKTFGGD